MIINFVTKDDMQEFKRELFNELKDLLPSLTTNQTRRWLRSYEVKQLLNSSTGALQTLNKLLCPKKSAASTSSFLFICLGILNFPATLH